MADKSDVAQGFKEMTENCDDCCRESSGSSIEVSQ